MSRPSAKRRPSRANRSTRSSSHTTAASGKTVRPSAARPPSRRPATAAAPSQPAPVHTPVHPPVRTPDVDALVSHVSRGTGVGASDSGTGGHAIAGVRGVVVCPPADGFGGRDGVVPPGVAASLGLYAAMRPLRAVTQAELDAERARASRESRAASASGTPSGQSGQSGSITDAVDAYRAIYADAACRLASTGRQDTRQRVPQADDPDATGSAVAHAGVFSAESEPAVADGDADTLDGFYDELARRPPCTSLAEGAPAERREGGSAGGADSSPGGGSTASWGSVEVDANPPAEPNPRMDEIGALRRTCDELSRRLEELRQDRPRPAARKAASSRAAGASRPGVVRLDGAPTRLKVGGFGLDGGPWECRIEGSASVSDGVCTLVVVDPSYAGRLVDALVPGRIAVLGSDRRFDGVFDGDAFRVLAWADDPGILVVRFDADA